jgi:hypothetical protein
MDDNFTQSPSSDVADLWIAVSHRDGLQRHRGGIEGT